MDIRNAMQDDILYKVALAKLPKVGAVMSKQLIAYCGGVEAVFQESKRLLLRIPGIGESLATAIATADPEALATEDLKYYIEHDIKPVFYLDDEYPQRLHHFDDAPILFFKKGNFQTNAPRTVAIVGTRKPSAYGAQMCELLVAGLKSYDVQIISGLAHGIDAIAHRQSNIHKIENIAVMGTGIDVIYPSVHRKLAAEITQNGALITEYSILSRADKEHFPRRNRIIAGMADAVVVVQSAKKGGSLITAEYANNYNRDVFAFPGRVSDDMSMGCNQLIKQTKAHLIESAKDIGYIMRWETSETAKAMAPQKQLFVELSEAEQTIFDLLEQREEAEIDWLSSESGMTVSQLANELLQLECKGLLKSLPGKRYMKI